MACPWLDVQANRERIIVGQPRSFDGHRGFVQTIITSIRAGIAHNYAIRGRGLPGAPLPDLVGLFEWSYKVLENPDSDNDIVDHQISAVEKNFFLQ